MLRENIINKIKYIILIMISMFILSSCDKKNDNKEIKYTLSENIELGECDEFSETFTIPSHQYVHITFTKNTNWCVYQFGVYEKNTSNFKDKITTFMPIKTNIYDEDISNPDNLWNMLFKSIYLENKDYYVDIYNDTKYERELIGDLINIKKYDGLTYDITRSNSIFFEETLKNQKARIIRFELSYYEYGEKYKIDFSGDECISMKILDSYGNEVGEHITRDTDENNYMYYACIYNNGLTGEEGSFSISADYEDIYDGYEYEILPHRQSNNVYNRNYYKFICQETGSYDITKSNDNIWIYVYDENMDYFYANSQSYHYEFVKDKKYYIAIVNKSLNETSTGVINIKKVD